jgi:hypothetical protein
MPKVKRKKTATATRGADVARSGFSISVFVE